MYIRKKELSSFILLLFVMCIFICIYLPITQAFQNNAGITIQFLLIGLFALIGMIVSTKNTPFSLGMIFWFFCFAFLFCGGLTQFAKNRYLWGLVPSIDELEYANYLILLFMFIFAVGRCITVSFTIGKKKQVNNFWGNNKRISNNTLFPVVVILAVIGIYPVITSGIGVLFNREIFGGIGVGSRTGSSAVRTLITTTIRGFATWTMFLAAQNFKREKTANNCVFLIVTLLIGMLIVPPLGVARYVFAAVYGGLIIYTFDFLKKGRYLLYALAIGLLILFPLLNAFRGIYTDNVTLDFIKQSLGNISTNFTKADYDAYSMIVFTIQYVKNSGLSLGYQLLGALLFFIPSNLWHGKPGGSGATIIEYMNTGYNSNVSCPIIAEGYINFGIFGVILFALVLGYLTKRLDNSFWCNWEARNCPGKMIYSFLLLFFVFMCRGDLMSTFAYLMGYCIALFILLKFLGLFNKSETLE